jgi:hypothetical protein
VTDDKKELDPYLDPRFNPMLPLGGENFIIPKSEVKDAVEEIAGQQIFPKILAGEKPYAEEYGRAAVPSIGGRELVLTYSEAAADGSLEVLVDGRTLNQIDGDEAQAILSAHSALQSAIKKEEDRKKYLTMENPFIKIPD